MAKYIDADKLKAEIDNLESFSCISEEQDGFYSAISRINDLIDSLQQEKPDVDLEKEIDDFFPESYFETAINFEEAAEKFARFYDQGTCDGIAQDCFIAGAKWQKKRDEEAIKTAEDHAFLAGADWQKEQFEKNRLANCDKLTKEEYDRETDFAMEIIEKEHRHPTFSDAIEYGMRIQKEQLIKGAVEVVVVEDWNPEPHPEITIPLNPEEFTVGDKVKLIVIKED